jgi:hypothetical protein
MGSVGRGLTRAKTLIPTAAGCAAFGTAGAQTVLQPVDALGNNNDFNRVLTSLDLHAVGHNRFPFPFAQLAFTPGHVSSPGAYWTSYLPVLKFITWVMTPVAGGTFDLRILGLLYSVAFGLIVFEVCRHFTGPVPQLSVGAVLVVGLGDAHLVAYFDSFYEEPWSFIVLSSCVIGLLALNGRRQIQALTLLIWTVLAAALITAKTQNISLLIPSLAVTFRFSVSFTPKWASRLGRKAAAVACSLALVLVSALYLHEQPSVYTQDNLYDQVFADLLVHSSHPQADLASLDLPASMSTYIGTNAYVPWGGINTPAFLSFAAHQGRLKVEMFYISHPYEAVSALERGVKDGTQSRLAYLSYHTAASTSLAGSDGCGLCIFSESVSHLDGGFSAPVMVVALYVSALIGAVLRRRQGREGVSDSIFFLVAVSFFSLLTAVFGEGTYEEVKHLYLFYLSNIFILALTTGLYVEFIRTKVRVATTYTAAQRRWPSQRTQGPDPSPR